MLLKRIYSIMPQIPPHELTVARLTIFVCISLFFFFLFFFVNPLPMVIFISSQYLAPVGGPSTEEIIAKLGLARET